MSETILGRLSGGPLDTQIIPLDAENLDAVDDELVLPWEQGQLIYRRAGDAENTGPHDGPTTVPYRFDSQI
ncbi:response regulator [Homoserinibacter sp. GY 40078]|uniref:response regulator n=1 Tax=Homoserinibacter sp. GY 40078 TaxID=2603275 RepID=UPI0011CA7CB6|nr:response regulator [Homoserinibacter sp. GY 40078]TXK19574.1 response regulator [Homoserinibacter sp. GY 40078]